MAAESPTVCPSCGTGLRIAKLECPSCGVEVAGDFGFCPVCRLDSETRALFGAFVRLRGNVTKIQEYLGVSYPTARQRVEEMFAALENHGRTGNALGVLKKLREGAITLEEAEKMLRRT